MTKSGHYLPSWPVLIKFLFCIGIIASVSFFFGILTTNLFVHETEVYNSSAPLTENDLYLQRMERLPAAHTGEDETITWNDLDMVVRLVFHRFLLNQQYRRHEKAHKTRGKETQNLIAILTSLVSPNDELLRRQKRENIPQGKKDAVFRRHSHPIMGYHLIIDGDEVFNVGALLHFHVTHCEPLTVSLKSKTNLERFDIMQHLQSSSLFSLPDMMQFSQGYVEAWTKRVEGFRNILAQNNLWTSFIGHPGELKSRCVCPCRASYYFNRLSPAMMNLISDVEHQGLINGDEDLGVPVHPMSVVFAIPIDRFNISWPTFESVIQQKEWPSEIIVLLFRLTSQPCVNVFSAIRVLREVYQQAFPTRTRLRVFVDRHQHDPGENRWFGLNQSTNPIVSMLDSDDYYHPSFFGHLWRTFVANDDLDAALVGSVTVYDEGLWTGDNPVAPIIEYLQNARIDLETGNIPNFRGRNTTGPATVNQYQLSQDVFKKARNDLPRWNKTWWFGNTDAEPNWGSKNKEWGDSNQMWWYYGCVNGWLTVRPRVFDLLFPPVRLLGSEDAIFNYRIVRAGYNLACLPHSLGVSLKFVNEIGGREL